MEALRRAPADVAGVESGWVMRDGGRTVMRYLPDPARDLRRRLLFQPCMAPSTVLLRRSAFEALGGFRADLLRLQDWELWIRLADRYRMLTIPKIHAVRRPSELSASAAVFYVRRMVEILRPRIDRLPPRKRRAVLSRHLFAEGVELARAGQPREARSRLWRAWCSSPTHVRPLAHVGRTFLGERSWTAFAGGTRRVAQGVASLVGADLYLYRW